MGTSDLLAELSKDSFRATPDVERKVTEVVLKQLDDRSADVSSLAVKCIPPLVKGASEKTTETVIDALCAKLAMTAKSDAQRRDAGVIGLKSLVAELGDSHPASGAVVASLEGAGAAVRSFLCVHVRDLRDNDPERYRQRVERMMSRLNITPQAESELRKLKQDPTVPFSFVEDAVFRMLTQE